METYLQDLMAAQIRQGCTVEAIVHSAEPAAFDEAREIVLSDSGTSRQNATSSEDEILTARVTYAARWFNVGVVPIAPGFIFTCMRIIKRFKPDIIHVHHPNSSSAWLLLSLAARNIPWSATWHSDVLTPQSSLAMRWGYFFYRPIEKRLLGRAGRIFVTSPPYHACSSALSQVSNSCVVIPLGLDRRRLPHPADVNGQPTVNDIAADSSNGKAVLKSADEARFIAANPAGHTASPTASKTTVLYVGRLAKYKGTQLLLEALQQLPDSTLWLVGDGAARLAWKNKVEELGIQDRVIFWGAVENETLWRLYQGCTLFCLPSTDKAEAFGMVLLEAAHFHKPAVVADIPGSGVPWVAHKLGNCVVVPPNSAEALAEGIEKLSRRVHANAGATDLASNTKASTTALDSTFNLDKQAAQIIAEYEALIKQCGNHTKPES